MHNYYGLSLYTPLNVSPFTAVPVSYTTILLNWTQPQGTPMEFRLIANRYGFPVDENDGNILIDSTTYPGSAYADLDIIPGTYHYYGIYLLNEGIWNRSGLAACLAPFNYDSGGRMFSLLPVYFQEIADSELTQESADNQTLQQFLDVLGWGMDYLRTQYDLLARHLNDPMYIPLADLIALAGEVGMPFQPELPAYVMRKAAANWTHVCQERGTPGGLSEHVTLLTGYPVDLQSAPNQMLENDQSMPQHPQPAPWNPGIGYVLNEMVTYGNYIYKCILAGGLTHAPTGTTSANTWWQVVQNVTDPAASLANAATVGGINTWQVLYPALDSGGSFSTPAGSLVNTIGLPDPLSSTVWQHSAFSVFNKTGGTQDLMLRSLSQVTADRTGTNTNMLPDQLQVVKDGIPVPRVTANTSGWDSAVRYGTGDVVLYQGILYQAQRASTNAVPPSPGTPVNANPYFETTVSPWTGHDNATVAQSATQAFQGSDSMKITPDGVTANPGALSEQVTVIPGAVYACSAWTFIPAGWSTTELLLTWYDPFGQVISAVNGGVVNVAASTWTQLSLTATAPSGAATAQVTTQLNGTPSAATVSYWDAVVLACGQTTEWAVMSRDNRMRLMLSGYGAQSLTTGPNQTVQVVPFVEWYDEGGSPIISNSLARVTARTAVAGTPGGAPNLSYDSFTLGAGTFLNGRLTDSKDQSWTTNLGAWSVSGFSGGTVYPATAGTRSMATLTSLATGIWIGVTFASTPQVGQDAGIVFRAASTSSYWRAGMTGLYKITAGSATLVSSYSTPALPGDRLVVSLSGSVITVYVNGAQVATTTDAFNSSATLHGLAVENTGV